MAGSVNKIILIGHCGKEPKITKAISSGKRMAFFSMATTKRWRGQDGQQRELTQWHQICVFDEAQVATVEATIRKGSYVFVEGELQYRKYTDTRDNVEREKAEIVLNGWGTRVEAITPDQVGQGSGRQAPEPQGPAAGKPVQRPAPAGEEARTNDEIPF